MKIEKIHIILFYSFLFYSFLFFSFLFFLTFLFFSMFPHGFDLQNSRARRPLQGDRIIHTDGQKREDGKEFVDWKKADWKQISVQFYSSYLF